MFSSAEPLCSQERQLAIVAKVSIAGVRQNTVLIRGGGMGEVTSFRFSCSCSWSWRAAELDTNIKTTAALSPCRAPVYLEQPQTFSLTITHSRQSRLGPIGC